jgi:hypothetical protein
VRAIFNGRTVRAAAHFLSLQSEVTVQKRCNSRALQSYRALRCEINVCVQAMKGFAPLNISFRSVMPRERQAARSPPSTDCSDPTGVRRTFLTELMAVKASLSRRGIDAESVIVISTKPLRVVYGSVRELVVSTLMRTSLCERPEASGAACPKAYGGRRRSVVLSQTNARPLQEAEASDCLPR